MTTTKQARDYIPNPTGKGGFQDHPELRNDGRWDKNNSYSYWLNYFKTLNQNEFDNYFEMHPEASMSARGAYERIKQSIVKLDEFKESANRTEGMPKQSTDLTSGGEKIEGNTIIFKDFSTKNDSEG